MQSRTYLCDVPRATSCAARACEAGSGTVLMRGAEGNMTEVTGLSVEKNQTIATVANMVKVWV